MKRLGLLSITLLLSASLSFADDLDDMMGDFDSDDIDTSVADIKVEKESWINLSGDYTLSTAYNYDSKAVVEGLSRLRNTLNVTFDMKFSDNWKSKIELKGLYDPVYELNDITGFTPTLQEEAEFKEAYIQGTMGEVDLTMGRQTTVWGKSDNIRIADVINPMDNREAGMVDIKSLRLPVTTTKLAYAFNADTVVKLMFIHESRIQKEAEAGSEFLPTTIFGIPASAFPAVVEPSSEISDPQLALSFDANSLFKGFDLSLYTANVLDQRWYINNGLRYYSRITMSGLAANKTVGAWTLKTEFAFLDKLRYNSTTDAKSRLDALLGLDYNGIKDVSITLEVANRHINDYETQMLTNKDFVREDEMQTALRTSYVFDHDNATLTYLVSIFGTEFQDGGFQRAWLEYKVNDSVIVTGGFIDYIGGEKPYFEAISVNDRAFFDIKYSF